MPTAPGGAASRKRARGAAAATAEVSSDDFAVLQAPHPYGVLPAGNRLVGAPAPWDKNHSLTDGICATSHLNEECWHAVLSCLDGPSLAAVGQTSRFLYVAAHQPELWRDLVLRARENSTIVTVGPTWKDSYVRMQPHNFTDFRPHVPLAVHGVYSDYYYRLHSCRAFALPRVWLNGGDSGCRSSVPQVSAAALTVKVFLERFERPNRPVLVRGGAADWPAFKKWQSPAYCAAHTAAQTFRATSGATPLAAQFTWQSYRDYCVGDGDGNDDEPPRLLEEGPLYLFDRTALKPDSVLWKDYMYGLQSSCPYWDPDRHDDAAGHHDLFGILKEGRRPDHTWLIAGPRRSGSVFHIDPNATHAWNAAIAGRKRWIFYPPGVPPPGVHPSHDGDEVALPLSIGEWLFQFWDEHARRKRCAPDHERPLECTALPGDVLFVPHGWWHMVINLDAVNIAITHNYVSASNLSNVLKFLDTKRKQVSGCRDRAESIKPERLHEEFVRAMAQHHPKLLQMALAVPDWTCRAWKSGVENCANISPRGVPSLRKTSVMEKATHGNDGFRFSFAESITMLD